ncbi:MAG: membrane protein insertase YidC [Bacteroidales bacterium]
MDRNQVIGILLIFVILIGYSIYTQPSKEEMEAKRKKMMVQDSIAKLQKESEKQKAAEYSSNENQLVNREQIGQLDTTLSDSTKIQKMKSSFGSFGETSVGNNKFIVIENDLIKLTISTKGGRPYSVQLKNYMRFDSMPLILFNGEENIFGLNFFAENRKISTNDLFFNPDVKDSVLNASKSGKILKLKLDAGNNRYIEYVYKLVPGDYMVDFDIRLVGMDKLLTKNTGFIDMNWFMRAPGLEKGKDWENQNSHLFYKYFEDEVGELSPTKDDEEALTTKVKWIAFKQQFFSSVIIAKTAIMSGKVSQKRIENDPKYLKEFNAVFSIPFEGTSDEKFSFGLFYGPNQYKILNNMHLEEGDHLDLTNMIPLGWTIFGWINRFAIIPLFNWLGGFITNYGLIILIMTIIIKLVLFPLTYKSYVSSAKMRVLKPEIDAINAKIPKDKAMDRQQATMALYKKVGVNPLGGCLPMLLQFPILIAMYRFFPASIELRQKAFLWTDDLSSYDSILNLPFNIPFYGDHVSLFTLLMAISIVVSSKISGAEMQGNTQMPGMKAMIYMMPVMMLLWFNNYSSGLSYYYFLSNVITIGQTLIIRRFVDDEAVLKKLNENKKKPQKKSKFQERLEKMAKERGYSANRK